MRAIVMAVLSVAALSACTVVDASGPGFGSVPQTPVAEGQARVYAFRGKVLYLAQAPHIRAATIAIDGHPVGNLANGGFLTVDVSAGRHSVSASSAAYLTVRTFDAVPGAEVYVEVWDKTRMEGPPIVAAGVVGGAIGGAVAGGIVFSGGDERVWGVDLVQKEDALGVLQGLSLSE